MPETGRSATFRDQAIRALQSGRAAEARRLLASALRQDPQDVDAWVWLGKAMDDPAKRRECFARALRLDPDNEEARRGMVALLSGPDAAPVEERPSGQGAPAPDTAEFLAADEDAAPPKQIAAYPSRCRSCGAAMRYDVARRALRCEHCGTEKPIPAADRIVEWLGMPPDLSGPESQGELIRRETLRCRSCGATTELSSRTASLSCPYCGSPQVIRGKGRAYLIPPRALVPFAVDAEAAREALRAWFAEGYWHPDDLADKAELVEMHGAYLPFWGFKGLAEVTFQMQGSGLAMETLPMVPGQQTQHINVDELLIPGTLSIEPDLLHAIQPFDLDQAVPFHPEYLAGWPAEVYQVALADATIEARGRMSKEARNKAAALTPILNLDIGDTYSVGGIPVRFGGTRSRQQRREVGYRPTVSTVRLDSFMHYVLPVWLGTYRYRGRSYAFAINGQTGKVGGRAPRGGTNLVLTVVLGVLAVAVVGFLLLRFWPQAVAFLQGLLRRDEASGGAENAKTTLNMAVIIVMLFVPFLFTIASQWNKIGAWFGGGEDDRREG